MPDFRDLNWYKKNISLPDFLVNVYGFEETSKSTRTHPKLRDPKNPDFVINILLNQGRNKNGVSYNSGHFVYFVAGEYSSKPKTIIDFLMEYHSEDIPGKDISFSDVKKYLDSYLKGDFKIKPSESNYTLSNQSKITSPDFNTLKPCKNRKFFYDRGIDDWVIDHPLFSNVVANKSYYDKATNTTFHNIAFKMYGLDVQAVDFKLSNNPHAIAQRNNKFSGCLGPKEDALCLSNPDHFKDKPIRIIFGETMDDLMSYYQLFHNYLKNVNPYFISSQGTISEGQIKLLNLTLKNTKVKFDSFVFATDRDNAGEFFISKILSKIEINDSFFIDEKLPFKDLYLNVVNDSKVSKGYCDFKFNFETDNDAILTLGKLKEFFKEHNINFNNLFGKDYEPSNLKINDKFDVCNIEFYNNSYNWRVINSFLFKYKFRNKFFLRHRPLLKDFNEDLQAIKNLHKDYTITDYYNSPKVFSIKTDKLKRNFFEQTRGCPTENPNIMNIKHDFLF